MNNNIKISKAQQKVLEKMIVGHWHSACDLQTSIATLNALVKKDILEKSEDLGLMFFPPSYIKFKLKQSF